MPSIQIKSCSISFLLVVLAANTSIAFTGHSLRGTIRDSKTKAPVPFCSVFLARTLVATIASAEGNYELRDIPEGKYDLTITSLGYKTFSIPWATNEVMETRDFELEQQVTTLSEVVIRDHSAKKKYIQMFEENFLGQAGNSKKCKIVNLKDIQIDFDKDSSIVTAFCDVPIEVENNALGYRLLYTLTDFRLYIRSNTYFVVTEGIPRFELLRPTNSTQSKKWAEAREVAYRGSLNHFMRSLKNSALNRELFAVAIERSDSANKFVVVDEPYVLSVRSDSLRAIGIVYHGEKPDPRSPGSHKQTQQVSWLRFTKTGLRVYSNGYYDLPKNFFVSGYMSWKGGVAELVPIDYQPLNEK